MDEWQASEMYEVNFWNPNFAIYMILLNLIYIFE